MAELGPLAASSNNVTWLVAALAVVALAIGGYVALLVARLRKLEERLRAGTRTANSPEDPGPRET